MAALPPTDCIRDVFANRAGRTSRGSDHLPRVFERLRVIARDLLGRERRDHSWEATDLAQECFIELHGMESIEIENRQRFEYLIRSIQKHLLVDRALARAAQKRGGGWRRVPLGDGPPGEVPDPAARLDLATAVARLETEFPSYWDVIERRFFRDRTVAEIAAELGKSPRMVQYTIKAAIMKLADFLVS